MNSLKDDLVDINKCIIVNKTVQHLIHDMLKSVKPEIINRVNQKRELITNGTLSTLPEYNIHRPFFRLRGGEVPPLNIDAMTRLSRRELNMYDVRTSVTRQFLVSEMHALIDGVASTALERRVEQLESKRQSFLSKLPATVDSGSTSTDPHGGNSRDVDRKDRQSLLIALKDVDNMLLQFNSMPPTPPKWLTTAFIKSSVCKRLLDRSNNPKERKSMWEKRIFRRYHGPKFMRQYAVHSWISILSAADDLISDGDWAGIALHKFKGCRSDNNLRLHWHHQLKPGRNLHNWTVEEDTHLVELANRLGKHGRWEQIASELDTNRTGFACFQRWQTVHNSEFQVNRPWTVVEDGELLDILNRLLENTPPPLIDWQVVAAYHTTRADAECRLRAPAICPLFKHTEIVNVSTVTAKNISTIMRKKTPESFTADEDLQLLLGIQRHGIGGGRAGRGIGIGAGSWALVAIGLPGKTAQACRNRYLTLCDQFQPWTYTEDSKLFRLRLQMTESVENIRVQELRKLGPYRALLPHFRDRSTESLKQRFLLLFRWSRLWSDIRQTMPSETNLSGQINSDTECKPSTPSTLQTGSIRTEDLRDIILQSPFSYQFVKQLREVGVIQPEDEAVKLLVNWTSDQDLDSPFPRALAEFSKLLTDLACNRLLPGQPTTSVCELPDRSQSGVDASLHDARRVFMDVQLKQLLAGPVRRYLFLILIRGLRHPLSRQLTPVSDAKLEMLDMQKWIGRMENYLEERPSAKQSPLVTCTFGLLNDEKRFHQTLDRALNYIHASRAGDNLAKVAKINTMAPSVARVMSQIELNSEFLKPDVAADSTVPPDVLKFDDILGFKRMHARATSSFRSKLLRIKRLLHMYGRGRAVGTNHYALAPSFWVGSNCDLSHRRGTALFSGYIPPILRFLSDNVTRDVLADPKLIVTPCLDAVRASLIKALRLDIMTLKRSATPIPSTSSAVDSTHANNIPLMPPNYSSFLALKSLLQQLPILLRKGGVHLSALVDARKTIQSQTSNMARTNTMDFGVPLIPDEPFMQLIHSPFYSHFISIGLSILVWPALLSTIPAERFVEAGKRRWMDAFSQLPESDVSYAPNHKRSRIESDSEELDLDFCPLAECAAESSSAETKCERIPFVHPTQLRKAKLMNVKSDKFKQSKFGLQNRTRRFHQLRLRRQTTVRFRMRYSQGSPLILVFSADVKRLFASGFRPKSILSLERE